MKMSYATLINILHVDVVQYINVQRNVYILDLLKQTCSLHETEPDNVEKSSENNGEMLLEAISSDDDIVMDSEEVDTLVMFYINYTRLTRLLLSKNGFN